MMSPGVSELPGGALFGPPSTWTTSGGGPSSTALISAIPTGSAASFKRNFGLAADYVLSSLDSMASERAGLFSAYQQRHAGFDQPLGVDLGTATGTVSELYNKASSALMTSPARSRAPSGSSRPMAIGHEVLPSSESDDELGTLDTGGDYGLGIDLSTMEGVSPLGVDLDPGMLVTPTGAMPIPGASAAGTIPGHSVLAAGDDNGSAAMRLSPIEGLSRSFSELAT